MRTLKFKIVNGKTIDGVKTFSVKVKSIWDKNYKINENLPQNVFLPGECFGRINAFVFQNNVKNYKVIENFIS